ncbi:MAG: hypothetical protein GF398_07170 [Chitinivibrionales bacterium]|nr:hypothetical protein [Chitinivibrionales bacterium]
MIPKLTPALQQRIDSMLGSMSLTDKANEMQKSLSFRNLACSSYSSKYMGANNWRTT